MDRFTRNYIVVLAVIGLAALVWALYEDPKVAELNDLLEADTALAAYAYQFRVLRLENGIATMSTPRSSAFPVYRALGILHPPLAGRSQDDPDLMKAQAELARLQKRARAMVVASPGVNNVRWELDDDWLAQHGVQTGVGL
jgi:gamma-glutamyltranspeptidase